MIYIFIQSAKNGKNELSEYILYPKFYQVGVTYRLVGVHSVQRNV